MQEIGKITFLQVQKSPLKSGKAPKCAYDPTPITRVDSLLLSCNGIIGKLNDEMKCVMDVHHVYHPNSRNRNFMNGISIGFTSHYRQLRACYGTHIIDGIGGENIIVEADDRIKPEEIGTRLAIVNQKGERVYLTDIYPAPPCVEFSHFAANHEVSGSELKDILEFLNHGRRGYYAILANGHHQATVQPGDILCTVDGEF